jgi:serine phosphatase RsbU (regulator of sigma subunit)
MEALGLLKVRAEDRFLFHGAYWAATSAYLAALDLLTSGLATIWSPYPIAVWGVLLAGHWYRAVFLKRKKYEVEHSRLAAELPARGRPEISAESHAEIGQLRDKLLGSAEEARQALRTISPETAAEVSRGEARALEIVAWLDDAGRLLSRTQEARELRQRVANTLSKPGEERVRASLQQLLAQLDLRDVKLATLEQEASHRRSLLESFFLIIESSGVARSSSEVLVAVSRTLRERVDLLEAVAGADVAARLDLREPVGEEAQRIHQEVQLARELQQSILPREPPELPGLSVAHFYRPSSEVGGDFFDFYVTGPGRLLVAVGDAAGHGLDSSMVSSMAKSALYTHVSARRSLGASMAEMNRMMCDTLGRRRLMTLALLEFDTETRRLSWVNAGQVFPLTVRGEEVGELAQPSYPLGARREVEYEVVERRLEPGDRFLLHTDGYFESVNGDGEVFGWERLMRAFLDLAEADVETIVSDLADGLRSYLEGELPEDDVTLVAIGFEP